MYNHKGKQLYLFLEEKKKKKIGPDPEQTTSIKRCLRLLLRTINKHWSKTKTKKEKEKTSRRIFRHQMLAQKRLSKSIGNISVNFC